MRRLVYAYGPKKMISNQKNEGKSEVGNIVHKDLYRVQNYPQNYFDYIVDIGANIGIFSVMMRMLHPKATIIAIEPAEETFAYLQQNTNMLNIITERIALGDGSRLYFQERPDKHILNHMFVKEKGEQWSDSSTLYGLFDRYNMLVKNRYMLKFDCEGGEKSLVNDPFSESIIRNAEHVSMEIHFQSRSTPYKHWLTYDEYNSWVRSAFQDTHSIDYYCSSKNQGYGHYCLVKKS